MAVTGCSKLPLIWNSTTARISTPGLVVDHGEFRAALTTLVGELDHRHLNDMLPGVVTTPEGIAIYIHERLILAWPHVTLVSVSAGPYRAVMEWTLR